MKVLIDSCVAKAVGAALATAGHEVESVADWPADPARTRVRLIIP